jgi:hypothetical protein
MGDSISSIGDGIGGAISGILPGVGGAISGIASGIGGLVNTFSGAGAQPGAAPGGSRQASASIFGSQKDFDDWVRYAYPAGGGDDEDPKTLQHLPFAGSGAPGPVEFSTSEEYADKARKKMDDVTDLGDDPLSTPMGDWQRQASDQKAHACYICDAEFDTTKEVARHFDDHHAHPLSTPMGDRQRQAGRGQHEWWDDPSHPMYVHPRDRAGSVDELLTDDEDDDPYREASVGYSTADDSDVVRTFQAHLGETALGAGAGGGGGRFDDIAGAAQGFLRTAGRNYSLAEQDELIREGDKGGARNLASLDLSGTHYEDMTTLGW